MCAFFCHLIFLEETASAYNELHFMLQIDLVALMIGMTSSICMEAQQDKTHCSFYFYELSVFCFIFRVTKPHT